MVGVGQSIFEGSLLGKILGFTTKLINPEKLINRVTGRENLFEHSPFDEKTHLILNKSKISVGVLLDKGFGKCDRIFIPIFREEEISLIKFAQKFIKNSSSQVTVLDAAGSIKNNATLKELIRAIEQSAPNHINLINERLIEKDFLRQNDLMLISLTSWKKLVDSKSLWLSDIPSSLIVSEKP